MGMEDHPALWAAGFDRIPRGIRALRRRAGLFLQCDRAPDRVWTGSPALPRGCIRICLRGGVGSDPDVLDRRSAGFRPAGADERMKRGP